MKNRIIKFIKTQNTTKIKIKIILFPFKDLNFQDFLDF